MVLRVFEKSAHTKPVLALYRSLLTLSSNRSLDPVLSSRLQRRIRNGFRKNQKLFSARLVKSNLIHAFNIHSQLERALNGSAVDLQALLTLAKLQTAPPPRQPNEREPPPRPPNRETPHVPNMYRAPTIRFSQHGFVLYQPPVRRLPGNLASRVTARIRQFRRCAEILTFYYTYQWHVTQEESFLRSVAQHYSLPQGTRTEAGLREHNGMIALIKKAMSHIAWVEEVRAEQTLKQWVRGHPGALFQPYGKAMTKARKREIKAWDREVRKVRRENQLAREQNRFKNKWEKKWGETPVLPVKSGQRRQRTYKVRARNARKARMGHPEKVLKKNVV